ncbi:MAG: sulfatase-like hydrolase/transferase [Planctomycetota bacterium]|nr:sulfatase-like hydrolase/transferase [Planctomycetota bacterium]MDA1214562.1 sulfatase-like hydrolase/transferase [Planctomycetota bacterium]
MSISSRTYASQDNIPLRPNVLIVLCDDLGYGDLACYGHPEIKTPNLDRFAKEGLRLTSCYASHANCSPSRAGLMTGRTPFRAGIHNWIPYLSPMHLRSHEITIATVLQQADYETCHVGKWHLNGWFNLPGQPQPIDHGFDHWCSTQNNALPDHREPYNFVRNGVPLGPQQGYSSEIVATESIRWLRDGRDPGKQFFLFVCFHEPHEPIATRPRYAEMYMSSDDPSRSNYFGNVTQMDVAFGRIMRELDRTGLDDNTFVFFTSDNGPARTGYHNVGSSGPLREFKGHMYEGGLRVPGIVRWPGHIAPGSDSDEPVCGVDILPTICEIAGIAPPTERSLDGTSIVSLFTEKSIERSIPLYWQFNGSSSAPKVALRKGDWKILAMLDTEPKDRAGITDEDSRGIKSAKITGYELYNLRNDIGETTDLAASEPDKLRELKHELDKKYDEVREETPTWPAWIFARYEGQRIRWPEYRAKPREK